MQQLVRVCNMAMASYICSFPAISHFSYLIRLYFPRKSASWRRVWEREREREETGNGNFLSLNIISQFPGKPPLQTPQRIWGGHDSHGTLPRLLVLLLSGPISSLGPCGLIDQVMREDRLCSWQASSLHYWGWRKWEQGIVNIILRYFEWMISIWTCIAPGKSSFEGWYLRWYAYECIHDIQMVFSPKQCFHTEGFLR